MNWRALSLFFLSLIVSPVVARAQFELPTAQQLQGFQPGKAAEDDSPVTVRAVFSTATASTPARLYITAEIKPGWHIYSLTQPKNGPLPSKIKLPESPNYRVVGDFKPSPPATVKKYPDAYGDLPIEEHEGRVTWYAPIEIPQGVQPGQLKIEGKLNAQACNADQCRPPKDHAFTAQLGPPPKLEEEQAAAPENEGPNPAAQPTGVAEYKSPRSHSTIRGSISPQNATPGSTVQLTLAAEPAEQWHVYAWSEKPGSTISKPTLIAFTATSGLRPGRPQPSSQPAKPKDAEAEANQPYHEGPITWSIPIEVPADASPGVHPIAGVMGYQTCWEGGCDLPQAVRFTGTVTVGQTGVAGSQALLFTEAKYSEAAKLAAGTPEVAATGQPAADSAATVLDPSKIRSNLTVQGGDASLPLMLLFGFLGGALLNLMPCVLPVIGLKILSFVEQSGQDRGRVLWLNIWYSLGLLSVFWILAALAITLGLGWGQQFSSSGFNVALASIVFAMGLSFLGVWEIPIPGFVGSGQANDLAAKEGVAGAFAKGVITTVLATPCTGPFLGTSLAWAVRQPPLYTAMLFTCAGLGMASPYLAIGAFPSLVKLLPRPGMWMETFKQTMGFVLLGTVVFLLTFIEWSLVVPTVAMLFGIWAACWWIGRTPYTADFGVKARSWLAAATFVAFIGLVSFSWLQPVMAERLTILVDRSIGERVSGRTSEQTAASGHRLPWKPFTQETLQQLTRQQRTVMVDFTADWCLVCKLLEKGVLNTENVKSVIDTHDIVPLVADWTNGDEEVTAMLELLGSKNVPVLAIFPAGRPNEPIVFRDPYTQQQLIEALQQAGPSKELVSQANLLRK